MTQSKSRCSVRHKKRENTKSKLSQTTKIYKNEYERMYKYWSFYSQQDTQPFAMGLFAIIDFIIHAVWMYNMTKIAYQGAPQWPQKVHGSTCQSIETSWICLSSTDIDIKGASSPLYKRHIPEIRSLDSSSKISEITARERENEF